MRKGLDKGRISQYLSFAIISWRASSFKIKSVLFTGERERKREKKKKEKERERGRRE